MTNEMVNALNFGGGEIKSEKDLENRKKTREERHAEIIEKSKAYKYHHQEIKEATQDFTRQLDEEWGDIAALLKFGGNSNKRSKINEPNTKPDEFDNVLTQLKCEGMKKV